MMTRFSVQTQWGAKQIEVFEGNLADVPETVDVLVCSAFWRDYRAIPTTLIGSLWRENGISVEELAQSPEINLKDLGVWISRGLECQRFGRIACVEMQHHQGRDITQSELRDLYDTLFFSFRKCETKGIGIESVAMQVLGTGNQGISLETSFIPLLTESISALKTLPSLKTIVFFDRNPDKCERIVEAIQSRTTDHGAHMAFISYSHMDLAFANDIANGLEANGIKPWIDHRMIRNSDYAEEIVKGISDSNAFLVLVSEHSMNSSDVLREVRNASVFSDQSALKIWPVLLEKIQYPSRFAYYLAGLDYIDISSLPVDEKALRLCNEVQRRIISQ